MNAGKFQDKQNIAEGRAAVNFHGTLARQWEDKYKKPSFAARLQAIDELLSNVDLQGTRWLDAGCGTGTLSRWLASRGGTVLGVDASADMTCNAAQLSSAHPCSDQLKFEEIGTIENLPFAPCSFDGIVCSSVLEYLPQPERCLSEFQRVLRKGGLLVISVPNANSALRRALRFVYRVTNALGHPWPTYMSHSRNEYSRSYFETVLRHHDFSTRNALATGGPFPSSVRSRETLGSLIMVLAEKRAD